MDWNTVVTQIGPALHRYFSAAVGTFQAADLVQETLIRLVDKVETGQFDPGRGPLRAYAFGIAHFVRLEAFKRSDPEWEIDLSALEAPTSDDRRGSLRWAISRLEEPERSVLLLLVDEELQLAEIGAILTMPVGTVKSHVHRAKANLKRLLQDEVDHG